MLVAQISMISVEVKTVVKTTFSNSFDIIGYTSSQDLKKYTWD